jgi:Zn-dependent M28 family amino/carboxypeptidase
MDEHKSEQQKLHTLKKPYLALLAFVISVHSFSQEAEQLINKAEVERIEKILAADEMRGREAGKPGSKKAADFIASEFKKAGLSYYGNGESYLQTFTVVTPIPTAATGSFYKVKIDPRNIIAITSKPILKITEKSGYRKVHIKAGSNFGAAANKYARAKENLLVLVDTSFKNRFEKLNGLKEMLFERDKSVVFVLTNLDPQRYQITTTHEVRKVEMANVVGIIPGRSKKDEYVIFSAHYDHLGIGDAVENDSIYNGANDDAAGTTAVIMLAKYFKALANNERTIVFAAFTAEEAGGFGSQYFSRQFDPKQVTAMFNIEMIGTESKWGKNSAFITGYEQTNLGKIIEKNLEGTGFTFYPDPYPDQRLFYRSDNASLAILGVPAHTISTSKMDSEKYYHTVDDEVETLDIENMVLIIKAIALSAKTIISGEDAPTRVNTASLE